MALFICPDCGREVSTKAAACPGCGCPLTGDAQTHPCALVLLGPDPNDLTMLNRIREVAGCSDQEAGALRANLPAVLKRGVPYRDCVQLTERFTSQTLLSIVPDADADDPQQLVKARPLQREAYQPPKPLGFGTIVGGCFTALVLWGILSLVLTVLLSMN